MSDKRDSRYGINVRKWCIEHENRMHAFIDDPRSNEDARQVLLLHEKKLSWLMHERLIHLIVLFITVILALFSMALILFLPETLPATLPMFIIVFILLVFYVRHYFFLENTVQHWYIINEELDQLCRCSHTS